MKLKITENYHIILKVYNLRNVVIKNHRIT